MNIVGIIAEYNPFHLGHARQIAETRRALGDCAVVCAMSGHWVQRGECALTDKWTRAGMALRGGADLVLELPTPWATSSAESFARGGVGILAAAGVVDPVLRERGRRYGAPVPRGRLSWLGGIPDRSAPIPGQGAALCRVQAGGGGGAAGQGGRPLPEPPQ